MGLASNPPFENLSPQLSVFQQETSATADLQKLAVGLTMDTMLPFIQLDKNALWKPSTDPGKPTLPPLGRSRTASPDTEKSGEWVGVANTIIKTLSDDIKKGLESFNKLPLESRNSDVFPEYDQWKALDQVIKLAAHFEVFMTISVELSHTENERNAALIASQLPSIVSGSMVADSEKKAEMLKEELERRERHPTHDDMRAIMTDLKDLMVGLSEQLALSKERNYDS